jgi:aspartate/methionine/tyrosine aminotransferase
MEEKSMKIDDFKVERWMDAYETKCEINIAESCVDSLVLEDLICISSKNNGRSNEAVFQLRKKEFVDKIMGMKLTYGSIEGSDYLKNGIRNLYKNVSPEQIVVTHGAIAANYLVLMCLIEPTDEVITVLPTYQQHYSVPESIGAKVHKGKLRSENNFKLDLDEIRSLVNEKTKLISFANPNNPTGAELDEETLRGIVEIAKSVGAYVLSDEAYRGLNLESDEFTPSIVDLYEKGISTSSMSKTYALAGIRTGWVCSSRDVIEKINIRRDYNHISCSMVDDYIAAIALEHKNPIIARSKSIIKNNLNIIDAWIANNPGFSYVRPKAGPVIVIKYDLDMQSRDFCKQLLDSKSVLVIPGGVLDIENHFRVGAGNNSENLKEGLSRIAEFYNEIK